MTNREIADNLFEYIRKNSKFKPYDIQYGNCYFIFEGKPDSVIHFRVKGVSKQWKFGLWLESEFIGNEVYSDYPVLQFFAQWEKDIDKFKPTRSHICVSIDARMFDEGKDECFRYAEIIDALNTMKYHPILCYCGLCGKHSVDYFPARSLTLCFLKGEFYHFRKAVKKAVATAFVLPLCKFKVWRANQHPCVDFCEIYNYSKRVVGWKTSHDYQITCRFKENATDAEMAKVARIFKKMEYGRYDSFQKVAAISGYTQVGRDRPFVFTLSETKK